MSFLCHAVSVLKTVQKIFYVKKFIENMHIANDWDELKTMMCQL